DAMGVAPSVSPIRLAAIHNCLRLLKRPSGIILPFADLVADIFPTRNVEVRRMLKQFFGLIAVNAFLHQMQRKAVDRDGKELSWGQRGHVDHTLLADPRDYEVVACVMNPSLCRALKHEIT